jgi:glycosyltransferase involved in cell wall biosynthesis
MALAAGFERARAEIVVMMDADLQDDPADLPQMIEKIRGGLDVVVGWKVERHDPLNRRIFSRIFNGTVGYVTGVHLHDMNCGFKAYRQEVLQSIPIYGDLFRFIPVLASWQGFSVGEMPVHHRARQFGSSRYGLERILRGFFDLLSVSFLTKYSRKPMHLFGLLGLLFTSLGLLICGYLSVVWLQGGAIGSRPLLLLGVLLILVGVQSFSIGLLGEFMTFQYHRKHEREHLPVREVVGDPR